MKTASENKETSGLLSKSGLIFACRLVGAVLTFLTQACLARWMGAEQLGIYVLAFSWVLLLSTCSGLGYPAAAMRFIGLGLSQKDDSSIRGFIRASRRIVVGVSTGVAALGGLFIWLSDGQIIPHNQRLIFLLALVCVPIMALIRLQDRIAHAYSWFTLATLPTMVLRPLLFFLLVFGIWHYQQSMLANAAMKYHLLAMLIVLVGQVYVLRKKLRITLDLSLPYSYQNGLWLQTAAPLLIVTLFTQYSAEINLIIAGFFLPPADIAIYSTCFRIALLIGFGILAVNSAMMPRVSRLHADGDQVGMQRLVTRVTQLTFAGGLCAVLVLSVVGEWVLGLFGEEFTAGLDILMILALTQLVIATVGPVAALLSVTGHQNQSLYVFICALVATIGFNITLIPVFGLKGAALSVFVVTVLWSIWSHQLVKKHLNVHASILAFLFTHQSPITNPVESHEIVDTTDYSSVDSLMIKTISVFSILGLFALAAQSLDFSYINIAIILALFFWVLDGLWVYQKQKNRINSNQMIALQAWVSSSQLVFHGTIILAVVVLLSWRYLSITPVLQLIQVIFS